MQKRLVRLALAACTVLMSASCFSPYNTFVRIPRGYVSGSGSEILFVVECELAPGEGPGSTPIPIPEISSAISSVEGHTIVSRGDGKVTIDDVIQAADGSSFSATVDTSALIEDEVGFVYELDYETYHYIFSSDQPETIDVYNQYYIKLPAYSTAKHSMWLRFDVEDTAWAAASPRVDLVPELLPMIGAHPILSVYDLETHAYSYLLSDGTLVSTPTPFDESLTFNAGNVLDASSFTLDP